MHERMSFQGFIEVEGGEGGNIETGQPHGADDGDPKGVIGLFKGIFWADPFTVRQLKAVFDHTAMAGNIGT
ncbi:hypothetical protein myaer102_44850 [Microcystis viridis NIES-102]|uniref:Uncharacterized protein n=1 Tax=Microcystis viridis NIES-102 TaxID=213615 RepID=A0A3G9K6W3_MICVR|nr:hypothetical protein myaer102_44850 [Microcystis viridis NIES-102]